MVKSKDQILEDFDDTFEHRLRKLRGVGTYKPTCRKQKYRMLEHAMTQIADCDRMSSGEYEKIYGEDSDRDPYVIAEKTMEVIKVMEELQGD